MNGFLITTGFFTVLVAVSFVLVSVVSYIIDQVKEHNQTPQLLLSFIHTKKPKTYNN